MKILAVLFATLNLSTSSVSIDCVDRFFVSAVEIIEGTDKTGYDPTDSLYTYKPDRRADKGRGWIFKFNQNGDLIDKAEIWHGDAYHPCGINYTPELDLIWLPVAECRPNSHTDIYVVHPHSMEYTKVTSAKDHNGGVVYISDSHTLHGVRWSGTPRA